MSSTLEPNITGQLGIPKARPCVLLVGVVAIWPESVPAGEVEDFSMAVGFPMEEAEGSEEPSTQLFKVTLKQPQLEQIALLRQAHQQLEEEVYLQ